MKDDARSTACRVGEGSWVIAIRADRQCTGDVALWQLKIEYGRVVARRKPLYFLVHDMPLAIRADHAPILSQHLRDERFGMRICLDEARRRGDSVLPGQLHKL